MTYRIAVLLATVSLVSLAGCASPNRAAATKPEPPPHDPRDVRIFDGASGVPVTWDDLISGAATSDAVLIGENHGHPLGLASAAAIFEDVLKQSDHAALALEFFERDDQSRLDDYLSGVSDEKRFRTRTGRVEANYPDGHRAMVEAAKAAGRPVFAANAPRATVSFARREGYDRVKTLSTEQQRLVRVPDELPTGRYRDDFEKLMSDSGGPSHDSKPISDEESKKKIDDLFRAQSIWDWTMAESVARSINAGNLPTLLVVGRFHVDFEGGLPQALRLQRPGTRATIVSFVDEWSQQLSEDDLGRGDYVIYVGPQK